MVEALKRIFSFVASLLGIFQGEFHNCVGSSPCRIPALHFPGRLKHLHSIWRIGKRNVPGFPPFLWKSDIPNVMFIHPMCACSSVRFSPGACSFGCLFVHSSVGSLVCLFACFCNRHFCRFNVKFVAQIVLSHTHSPHTQPPYHPQGGFIGIRVLLLPLLPFTDRRQPCFLATWRPST